jgi:hypothetical protein
MTAATASDGEWYAVLPSAAAGLHSPARRTDIEQAKPLVHRSENSPVEQSEESKQKAQMLSLHLVAMQKKVAKKEEDHAAVIKQLQARDQMHAPVQN